MGSTEPSILKWDDCAFTVTGTKLESRFWKFGLVWDCASAKDVGMSTDPLHSNNQTKRFIPLIITQYKLLMATDVDGRQSFTGYGKFIE